MRIGIDALMIDETPTGVGRYAINLINMIDKKINDDKSIEVYIQKKAKVYFKDLKNIHLKLIGDFSSNKERIIFQQIKLPLIIKNDKIDMMHYIDYLIPIFCNIPFIVTIHDLSFYHRDFYNASIAFFKRLISGLAIKKSKSIICVSDFTKRTIENKYKINNKAKTIYLGYDKIYKKINIQNSDKLDLIKSKYKLKNKFILFVGTVEQRKNIRNLISAYKVIENKIEHQLIIAGKKGWMFDEIFKMVEELNLKEKVIFTDYIKNEEMLYLYNLADLFVFPSFYEGFGIPPLEAMACGCPVIVSNTTSLPEVTGDAAILVDPNSVEDIADSMFNIITNRDLNNTLREKSLIQARKFSWEKCAEETMKLYIETGGLK